MASMELPTDIWDNIIPFLGHESHLQPLSLVSKTLLSITNHHKKTLKFTDQTALLLPALFNRFPNLNHLDFSELNGSVQPIIAQLADFGFRIETLNLTYHESFPLEDLPAAVFGGLRSLKMHTSRDDANGDDYMELMVKLFPNLEDLGVFQSDGYRRRTVHYNRQHDHMSRSRMTCKSFLVLGLLNSLRKIHLRGNGSLTDDVLTSISKDCSNLEEIRVEGCERVSTIGVESVLKECKNLKAIRLMACDYYHDRNHVMISSHGELRWSRGLSEIDFSRFEVSDDLLRSLSDADLPLKRVTFDRCRSFTFDGMMVFFDTYDDLDYLALVKVDFLGDSEIESLSIFFKKTRHLKLKECGEFSDSKLLTLIKNCPLLEAIEMQGNGPEDKGEDEVVCEVKDVVNHRKRVFNLANNNNLNDETLAKISAACPNLESLNLAKCGAISSKGVGEIMNKCRRLKCLGIAGCSGVANLGLNDTHTLVLESLEASSTSINDRALVDMTSSCPDLMFLNLSRCGRLTAKGVTEVVIKCTKLKEIDLDGCKNMTEKLLSWMIVNRPSLRKIVGPIGYGGLGFSLYRRNGCYVVCKGF